MKNSSTRTLLAAAFVLSSLGAVAQTPVPVPYLITSECPGSANNPSVLRRVPLAGAPVVVDTVNVAGTGIVVNGLGADLADPTSVYAMSSATSAGSIFQPPRFYRISLADGSATQLGFVTPPPAPVYSFPNIGLGFTVNQAADGAPGSRYFLTGVTLAYNIFTNTISDVRLYVGEISLAPTPNPAAPTWRQATLGAGATTIVNTLTAQANAYLSGASNSLPDGGFQDIAYVPTNVSASGQEELITYLGVEQQLVRVTNISTAPTVTVSTPSTSWPTGGAPRQIGSIWRDAQGRFFGLRSSTGQAYQFSPTTGDLLNTISLLPSYCSLGDATLAPGPVVLPVTLTQFDAAAVAGGAVRLTWQTASEENAARFVAERSADGRTWADGPTLAATNRPNGSRYELTDPRPGATRFYRLRLEDRDGHRDWSEARAVAATITDEAAVSVLPPWPNPATDRTTIALSAPLPGEATLLDQWGRVVWRGALRDGRAEADVRALPAGLYGLAVRFGNSRTARQRVVVAHD